MALGLVNGVPILSLALIAVMAWFIACGFLAVFEAAVDTIFLSFLYDSVRPPSTAAARSRPTHFGPETRARRLGSGVQGRRSRLALLSCGLAAASPRAGATAAASGAGPGGRAGGQAGRRR